MSVTNETRDCVNWHRLHCDDPGCGAHLALTERYGHLDRLREIAAVQGWTAPQKDPADAVMPRRWDFCPRHRVRSPTATATPSPATTRPGRPRA